MCFLYPNGAEKVFRENVPFLVGLLAKENIFNIIKTIVDHIPIYIFPSFCYMIADNTRWRIIFKLFR
jgi:hypothetical protein